MPKRKQADQAEPGSSSKRNSRRSTEGPSSSALTHKPLNASGLSNEVYPDLTPGGEGDDEDDLLAEALEQERLELLRQENTKAGKSVSDDYADDDPEEDDEEANVDEEENSEDEWRPPDKQPTRSSRHHHKSSAQNDHEEDDEDDSEDDYEDDELVQSLNASTKQQATSKASLKPKKKGSPQVERPDQHRGSDEEDSDFDPEVERAQAEAEAAAAWAEVRKRQNPVQQKSPAPTAAPSLTSWLGKGPSAASSVAELAAALPMPTTCTAAQIVDRSSLFVGYVYPLTNNTGAYVAALLSHLTRVVHPTVPVNLLPPQFANAPANKRGSSHDMYAYRVLQLKRGRSGVAGPDDFSLHEEKEDDGERWGGDRVLKVAREEGASDVLVVVSRWYGGELLGPVRFEHIENAARASVQKHIADEEIEEFRVRIQYLDVQIDNVKKKLLGQDANAQQTPPKTNVYADLDLQKGQRLLLARQKGLEAVQKRVQAQSAQAQKGAGARPSTSTSNTTVPAAEPLSNETSSEAPQASEGHDQGPFSMDGSMSGTTVSSAALGLPGVVDKSESGLALQMIVSDKIVTKEAVKNKDTDPSAVQEDTFGSEDGEDLTGWDELS